MELWYCHVCGHEFEHEDPDYCPECKSEEVSSAPTGNLRLTATKEEGVV